MAKQLNKETGQRMLDHFRAKEWEHQIHAEAADDLHDALFHQKKRREYADAKWRLHRLFHQVQNRKLKVAMKTAFPGVIDSLSILATVSSMTRQICSSFCEAINTVNNISS